MLALLAFVYFIGSAYTVQFVPFNRSLLSPNSTFEQFIYTNLETSPWHISNAKKYDEGRDEIVAYKGKWELSNPIVYPGFENDLGLVLKSKAAHHAIARKLDHVISNEDGVDLVVQYEVKLQSGLQCGGAYIKLLDEARDYLRFGSETSYSIMFGPDKCGNENKVQFILRKSVPENQGEIEEFGLKWPPMTRTGDLTTLYTLIIHANQRFEIRINGEVAKAGSLIDNANLFNPPLIQPKEIIDENDIKPNDWDDRVFIPDPNAQKPEDYDEKYAHIKIPDPQATKPEEWDENEPRYIEDPQAVKPSDWIGEWRSPLIVNPKCSTGCGKWVAPLIPNPNYVGPWFPPDIVNHNYQGVWKPRTIPNPKYREDPYPGKVRPIGGIGFELWSMDNNILFDNIYIGNSVADAELLGNETFKVKYELEFANKQENKPKIKNEPLPPPKNFDEILFDPQGSTLYQFVLFIKLFCLKQWLELQDTYFEFMLDPIGVILNNPIKIVLYTLMIIVGGAILFGTLSTMLFLFESAPPSAEGEAEPPGIKIYAASESEEEDPDHHIKIISEEIVNDDGEERAPIEIISEETSDDVSVSSVQSIGSDVRKRK
ncbi:Calnexin [Spathaspora sp. JA1]|nr:Calnexin [Spathaspora sp. JA1]